MQYPYLKISARTGAWVLALAGLLVAGGCNVLAPVGAVIGKAVPQTVEAAYKGLANQSVVVIVWADRGIRTDNPDLQLDLATGLEQKLKTVQKDDKPRELIGTTFPVRADSVARFQEDHPEMEYEPIDQTAIKFNTMFKATRLIYIEVSDFSTRSESSLSLHLGNLTGSIKVLEMDNGTAKEAFKESDIHVSFPKDSPPEGLPIGSDYKIYQGTLDLFTTQLANRLAAHEAEDEDTPQ
jgi:hypothetical protein